MAPDLCHSNLAHNHTVVLCLCDFFTSTDGGKSGAAEARFGAGGTPIRVSDSDIRSVSGRQVSGHTSIYDLQHEICRNYVCEMHLEMVCRQQSRYGLCHQACVIVMDCA